MHRLPCVTAFDSRCSCRRATQAHRGTVRCGLRPPLCMQGGPPLHRAPPLACTPPLPHPARPVLTVASPTSGGDTGACGADSSPPDAVALTYAGVSVHRGLRARSGQRPCVAPQRCSTHRSWALVPCRRWPVLSHATPTGDATATHCQFRAFVMGGYALPLHHQRCFPDVFDRKSVIMGLAQPAACTRPAVRRIPRCSQRGTVRLQHSGVLQHEIYRAYHLRRQR